MPTPLLPTSVVPLILIEVNAFLAPLVEPEPKATSCAFAAFASLPKATATAAVTFAF